MLSYMSIVTALLCGSFLLSGSLSLDHTEEINYRRLVQTSKLRIDITAELQLGAAWPKYHRNQFNIGQSPFISHGNNLLWSYTTREEIYTSAVIDNDNNLYIATLDTLLSISIESCKPVLNWKYMPANYIMFSTPVISSEGIIYFGSYDNKVHAVRPNGQKEWTFQTTGNIASSPTIGINGTIYAGTDDGYLYAIKKNGELLWKFQMVSLMSINKCTFYQTHKKIIYNHQYMNN